MVSHLVLGLALVVILLGQEYGRQCFGSGSVLRKAARIRMEKTRIRANPEGLKNETN